MDAAALRTIGLFEGLDDAELAACAEMFQETRVLMGDDLTTEDDFSYSLFLVLEGGVKVRIDGEEVATLGVGEHFGEVGLVTGERRNAQVTATETCQLAKLMTWDFEALTANHPVVAQRLEASAAARGG